MRHVTGTHRHTVSGFVATPADDAAEVLSGLRGFGAPASAPKSRPTQGLELDAEDSMNWTMEATEQVPRQVADNSYEARWIHRSQRGSDGRGQASASSRGRNQSTNSARVLAWLGTGLSATNFA